MTEMYSMNHDFINSTDTPHHIIHVSFLCVQVVVPELHSIVA